MLGHFKTQLAQFFAQDPRRARLGKADLGMAMQILVERFELAPVFGGLRLDLCGRAGPDRGGMGVHARQHQGQAQQQGAAHHVLLHNFPLRIRLYWRSFVKARIAHWAGCIGVGPSSSHTMGPMTAACRFVVALGDRIARVARVEVALYASLALTGRGHATDTATIVGLHGIAPEEADPDAAVALIQ
ncbi:hypothetical protein E4T56_gene13742, partial [Termitomyces sp. T112]